jgi:hypothetical protein
MGRKALFIWIFLLIFGFTGMPEVGTANTSKLAGKTELPKKKPKKNTSRKKTKKKTTKKKTTKKKRSSKKTYKKTKRTKKSKKRTRRIRRTYTPPTNSGSVEYRNYKRSNDNNENTEQNIEQIAPPKEIKKEPKKEGE